MSIISWIILGLIAGFIGAKIVNREGQGFWLDIALGIIGAVVGGFLFDFFGATGVTGLNIYSMIVAIVGSVVVLLVDRTVERAHCGLGKPAAGLVPDRPKVGAGCKLRHVSHPAALRRSPWRTKAAFGH
jgi:uncharacterized membrane protein YeaQ/YmgE (transglycosylase-associated protein family)